MKNLIIDAFNMIHRARFGQSGNDGITYTFFRSLRSEVEKHKPDQVFLVLEGRPVRRLMENSEYKANRTQILDEGFHRQKKDVINLCKQLPIITIKHPQHECDDVVAYIAKSLLPNDDHVICSSDTDFIQLLDETQRIKLWNPIKKSFVQAQPNYVVWKALRGDKADNIPGVKGVGDATATKLSNDSVKFEEFFKNHPEKKNDFDSSYRQILFEEIDPKNIQIEKNAYDPSRLMEEFKSRNFNSIVDKSWSKWDATWKNLESRCKQCYQMSS